MGRDELKHAQLWRWYGAEKRSAVELDPGVGSILRPASIFRFVACRYEMLKEGDMVSPRPDSWHESNKIGPCPERLNGSGKPCWQNDPPSRALWRNCWVGV